jgi:hypothetical protein
MARRALLPPEPGGELTKAEERVVACAATGQWWRAEFPSGLSRDPDPSEGCGSWARNANGARM